jgi:hypothetical protein
VREGRGSKHLSESECRRGAARDADTRISTHCNRFDCAATIIGVMTTETIHVTNTLCTESHLLRLSQIVKILIAVDTADFVRCTGQLARIAENRQSYHRH